MKKRKVFVVYDNFLNRRQQGQQKIGKIKNIQGKENNIKLKQFFIKLYDLTI